MRSLRFQVRYTKPFVKQVKKQSIGVQKQVRDRIDDFRYGNNLERLRDHALKGRYDGYRSINISGDIRAIYKVQADGTIVLFVLLGTHSQLYK